MTQIIKETVITRPDARTAQVVIKSEASTYQTTEYLIYFFFGLMEILLVFRLILKLLGASTNSAFVGFIYGITRIMIWPFEGIFRRGFAPGIETASVLEPSVLVALVVYAIVVWGIIKLIRVFSGEQQVE